MRVAVVRTAAGGIQILRVGPGNEAEMERDPASYYGRSIGKHPGDVLLAIVDEADIPEKDDRRGGWDWDGAKITVPGRGP